MSPSPQGEEHLPWVPYGPRGNLMQQRKLRSANMHGAHPLRALGNKHHRGTRRC